MGPPRRRRPDPYTPPLLAPMVAVVILLFLRELRIAYVPSNAPPPAFWNRGGHRTGVTGNGGKPTRRRVPGSAPAKQWGYEGIRPSSWHP
jgi:hypothetical protein